MKFYDGKTIDDGIIENMKIYNNSFEVKYLDNDNTYIYNIDQLNEIKDKMIKQALERDKELYTKYKSFCIQDQIGYYISLLTFGFSTHGNNQLLACILILIAVYFRVNLLNDRKKLKELKKYRKFLSIKDELEKKENKNILDVIEFDKYYQDPNGIGIYNLDDYSLWDINVIKKELKRRNNAK